MSINRIGQKFLPACGVSFSGKRNTTGVQSYNNNIFQKTSENQPDTQLKIYSPYLAQRLSENKIEQIYNETYEKVMREIPETKELYIKKPKLCFDFNDNGDTAMSYGILENSIKVRTDFNKNVYIAYQTYKDPDDGSEINYPLGFYFDAELKDFSRNQNQDIKIIKLNQQEKELYIASMFAHELRHCIQEHLILSTKGCGNSTKESAQNIKSALEKAIESMEGIKEYEQDVKQYRQEISDLDYVLNYKPKKLFDENKLFKYSLMPSDELYWSVKDDLNKSINVLSQTKENGDEYGKKMYYGAAHEKDAYNYEYEFLYLQSDNYPNARKDVISLMQLIIASQRDNIDF